MTRRNQFTVDTYAAFQRLAIAKGWSYRKRAESADTNSIYVELDHETVQGMVLRISNHPRPEWRVNSEPMTVIDIISGDNESRVEATIQRNIGYIEAARAKGII
jgi:hypothetical protein